LAYTAIIIAPILSLILDAEPTTVLTDPVGHLWQTHDIRSVEALVCLFTALPFWTLAVFKAVAAGRPSNH
jgi:putative membrane protein